MRGKLFLTLFILISLFSICNANEISFDDVFQETLNRSVTENIITHEQSQKIQAIWIENSDKYHLNKDDSLTGSIFYVLSAAGSKITLINVLYFGGALLVIGSMTLFMTLGFSSFGGFGLFLISLIYGLSFFFGAYIYFDDPEYKMVRGILSCISLGMVPLGIYGIMEMMNKTRYRYDELHRIAAGQWVPIEIGTVVIGTVIIYYVPFPFTTSIISFALWFMSMDLVPLFFRDWYYWDKRMNFSIIFGFLQISAGYYIEVTYSQVQDFAFWIYLFGLIIFSSGLCFYSVRTDKQALIALFLNIILFLLSHVLNRDMFAVFGGIGILLHFPFSMYEMRRQVSKLYMHVRFSMFILLLAIAAKSNSPACMFFGVLGLIHFNIDFVKSSLTSLEFGFLFHFLLNMVGMMCSWVFVETRLSFYFFSINGQLVIFSLCLVGAGLFHIGTAVHIFSGGDFKSFYCIYRLVFSYSLIFLSPLTGTYGSVWLGIAGIITHKVLQYKKRAFNRKRAVGRAFKHYLQGIAMIFVSVMLKSNLMYVGCLALLVLAVIGSYDTNKFVYFLFSLTYILYSVLLNMQMVLIIGAISIFVLLVHLSNRVFRNSMMFPFVLTLLGVAIIFLGIQYQKYHLVLHSFVISFIPESLLSVSKYSFITNVFPLQDDPKAQFSGWIILKLISIGYTGLIYFVFTVFLLFLVSEIYQSLFGVPEVNEQDTPILTIKRFEAVLPTDTNNKGIIFKITASKPPEFTFRHSYLHFIGWQIWHELQMIFGSSAINILKMTLYPVSLCPGRLDQTTFKEGEKMVEFDIHIGTGTSRDKATLEQYTITSNLRKLLKTDEDDFDFDLQVHYSNQSFSCAKNKYPSGVLFRKKISVRGLLNKLENKEN
eukprot:TRINITY_DN10157_c0_g1_i1.p1 TRINITY_DN10157_c0_g1~~TRINITY_DN10157_c0_g1_i1.p1  ORF type:complete len:889 (+),score=139.27 TRINITY_DN10157_c0_g1_i1:35-2668(+)